MAVCVLVLAAALAIPLSLAANSTSAICSCLLPTPCQGVAGCSPPKINNITQCPDETTDCRGDVQALCALGPRAEHKWCCWTACSSLAALRTCGDAPHGFIFENTGERDGHECHDQFNVREKCCLHEMRTMRGAQARSSECPPNGTSLVSIFEQVDSNRGSAPNAALSSVEVMNSMKWLDDEGYLFLATNFTAIDIDGNQHLSWYEVELFCGFVKPKLLTDISKVKPQEAFAILTNPLMLASLLSSLLVGELLGLLQVMAKHALHWEVESGLMMKCVYTFFTRAWPGAYLLFQIFYGFFKINWDVCKSPEGAVDISLAYRLLVVFGCSMFALQVFNWRRRKCPLSPAKDIERMTFGMQVAFKKAGLATEVLCVCLAIVLAGCGAVEGLFYGKSVDIKVAGIDACKREEPNLASLYDLNEKFAQWKVVQGLFLTLYCFLGWGIKNKSEYTPLPSHSDMPGTFSERNAALGETFSSEREKWGWFE